MTAHELDTIPCSFAAETVAPESGETLVTIPRDSEWSGFCAEMAEILAEVGE